MMMLTGGHWGGGRRGGMGLRWLVAAVAIVLATPAWLLAGGDHDRWYAIEMSGQRAGWMHTSQKTEGDRITSTSKVQFSLGRAQAAVSVSMEGTFVETLDGKPVSLRTVTKLGNMPTTMDCTFGEKELSIRIDQAGNASEMKRPLPEGTWLTPAAAGSYVKQRLAAKATEIVLRTIDPVGGLDPMSALTPATITHKDCRPETITVMGKNIEAIRCITTSSVQAGIESVEYLDEEGIPLRSDTTLGGIAMKSYAVDRADALADRPGPEMMVATFVKPDRAIPNPRRTSRAVYVLSVKDGKLPELVQTGSQKVEVLDERRAVATVDARRPAPALAEEAAGEVFLKPSATVNSDDAEIKRLAERATARSGAAKPERAETMRRFVHEHIRTKALGVGFATASEVARSREGDCTEHGVLLAAMLRADGIPSRVACGLIYADAFAGSREIFGYHMWAQALLEVDGKPTWVDLDGTLGPDTPYDATHITLATSALADGETQGALLALASILGRLEIKVQSVE